MSEEDAFIAGIRENPLDDLRRLVYADWLDERGRTDEAEYLRLVATLAAPGTAVDVEHPHAVRLVAMADVLEPFWREAIGSRFDLWFDPPPHSYRKLNLIKLVREVTNFGLTEAKAFVESLPKMLCGSVPLEEADGIVRMFVSVHSRYRILPGTTVSSREVVRRGVSLVWDDESDQTGFERLTGVEDTQAALGHLRRLLSAHHATAHLAANVPALVEEPLVTHSVTLAVGLLIAEADRQADVWRQRFFNGTQLDGPTAEPPFPGHISVYPVWQ